MFIINITTEDGMDCYDVVETEAEARKIVQELELSNTGHVWYEKA